MKNQRFFKEIQFHELGTEIYLKLVFQKKDQEIKARKDLLKAEKIYKKFSQQVSRFNNNSELFKLNNRLKVFNKASKEIVDLASRSLLYYKKSQRVFDPRVIIFLEKIGYDKDFKKAKTAPKTALKQLRPFKNQLSQDLKIKGDKVFFGTRMDFGGIAKGFVTDLVVGFLQKQGWSDFIVDSGGDIYAKGLNQSGIAWSISIDDFYPERSLVSLSDQAIATSGTKKRHWLVGNRKVHHLVNPLKPGKFSLDLTSVSVITKNTIEADFWAKTLFLFGKTKGMIVAKEKKLKSIFLDSQGNAFYSPAIELNLFKK